MEDLGRLIVSGASLHRQVTEKTITSTDSLEMFCASFLERSVDYATSVKLLVEVGQVASAALIVRTMLEGAACVHWVLKSDHPERRADKWRMFAYNESLKALDELEEGNRGNTNAYEIKREAQRRQALGDKLKNRRWTVDEQGREWKVRDLLVKLVEIEPHMSERMYYHYQTLSALTHWSPAGFIIDHEKSQVNEWDSAPFSIGYTVAAVGAADLSLLVIAAYVAEHFGIEQS